MIRIPVICVVVMFSLTGGAYAQSSTTTESASAEHVDNGIPIQRIIAAVSKKTGKKFVVDPRVHAEINLVGQDISNVSYSDLLTILLFHGYTAADFGGYVNVIPDASARQIPSPLLAGKENHPDAEIVTKVITVKSASAAQLVPILRPMIPQFGHLAALPCVNKLILVDTFANVRRLESVIESLDVGEPFKTGGCEPHISSDHPSDR